MKAFLEEYGLIIIVVAVIMVMLLLGTTVGGDAKANIVATVKSFLTTAEQVYPDLENPGGAGSGVVTDELNEYGFYYGKKYSTNIDGIKGSLVFYEKGAAASYENDILSDNAPEGTFVYEYGKLYIDTELIGVFSPDGKELTYLDIVFTLDDDSNDGIVYEEFTIDSTNYMNAGITREGNVVIPEKFEYNGKHYKTVAIADGAFSGCENLTSIVIPGSVKTIGNMAFANCINLESLTLNEGLKTIGYWAFYANKITSLKLPNSLTDLGPLAFDSCKSLKTLNIGSGLKVIPNAFTETGLEEVIIPSTVESLDGTFNGCASLKKVTLNEGLKRIDQGFARTSLTTIELPNSLEYIANYTFSSTSTLTSVKYKGVTYTSINGIVNALRNNGVQFTITSDGTTMRPEDIFEDTGLNV